MPLKILAIQSDKKELIKVEQFLKFFFEEKNLPDDAFNKVFLCVSEAVINSIEHGNKGNNNKRVTIIASCINNNLKIEVSDEGNGFDYNDVANPTTNENIRNETGRGIFIMRSICSNLNFTDKGKCVEIKIELV